MAYANKNLVEYKQCEVCKHEQNIMYQYKYTELPCKKCGAYMTRERWPRMLRSESLYSIDILETYSKLTAQFKYNSSNLEKYACIKV